MAVYIDDMQMPWRGMKMSHLTADTVEELHEFAAKLGLRPEWFQDKSIPHYDVSEGKRQLALKLGAIPESFWGGNAADRQIIAERHRSQRIRKRALEKLARKKERSCMRRS